MDESGFARKSDGVDERMHRRPLLIMRDDRSAGDGDGGGRRPPHLTVTMDTSSTIVDRGDGDDGDGVRRRETVRKTAVRLAKYEAEFDLDLMRTLTPINRSYAFATALM